MAKGTCTTPGCGRVELCKGLCSRCYRRARHLREYEPVQRKAARCIRCGTEYAQRGKDHLYCTDICRDAEKYVRRRARRRVGKSLRCDYCGAPLPARKRSDTRWCDKTCAHKGDYLINTDRYKAAARQWRLGNLEALKARATVYGKRNRKRIMARQAEWVAANREKHAAYHRHYGRHWRVANPERTRNYKQARRMREYGNPGSIGVPLREWLRLVNRHGGRCAYCGERPEVLHMDHVVPLARGGRHAIGNVLPACPPCNQTKAARFVVEWRHGRSALRT